MLLFLILPSENDEQDFAYIFEKYKFRVYAAAYGILQDRQYAEDAASETFYKIAKYFDRIKKIPSDELAYYITAIAKNTASDMYTKIHRRADVLTDKTDDFEDENAVRAVERFESRELYECIDKLPEKQKAMLLYKYGYGFSVKEIAGMLDEKENTVKVYIRRAKNKLAKLLGGDKNEK